MFARTTAAVTVIAILAASSASAGPAPAQKCLAAKLKIAATYAGCVAKAEAKSALKGTAVDTAKCLANFTGDWDAAEAAGAGECPDNTTAAAVQALLDGQFADAAGVIRNTSEIPECGDGSVNAVGELCDGSDLNSTTCAALGYASGTLACNSSCEFDVAGCVETADGPIDRAVVRTPAAAASAADQCEAAKLKAAAGYVKCRLKAVGKAVVKEQLADFAKCDDKFAPKWEAAASGGECADDSATAEVEALLTGQASETVAVIAGGAIPDCGDGVVNVAGEQCDGLDFATTCEAIGYGGGALTCDSSCRIGASLCGPCPTGMIFLNDICWVLGTNGPTQSCTAACAAFGMTCNEAALATVADGGTDADCRALIDLLHPVGAPHTATFLDMSGCGPASSNALGCVLQAGFNLSKRVVHTTPPQCGADNSFFSCQLGAAPQRACACD